MSKMVAYCCVNGCNSNSTNKKKDPNDITSFHAFPSNVEMKQKWLKAIGRPDWSPPSYSRVCSSHFSYEQINHDGRRIRIKDDAIPIKDLPANSNFEASEVEVCRFCLATDVRLKSLQDGVHRLYLESLVGYNGNYNVGGLPQFICYECAAHLKKCYNLLERSMTVQAILLDIFAQYGKITVNLINLKNRKELNLSSNLSTHEIKTIYELKYDIENNESINNENELKTVNNYITLPKLEVSDLIMNIETTKGEDMATNVDADKNFNDLYKDEDDNVLDPFDEVFSNSTDLSLDDEANYQTEIIAVHEANKPCTIKNNSKSSYGHKMNQGLTPDEVRMQEYYNVVRLTLEQQTEEWNKSKGKALNSETFKCQICSKVFAHHKSFKLHTRNHDPSRGRAVCPVCKLRFSNEVLAQSHVNRAHAKKFFCKLCPKAFNNVGMAKKHHKWHSGYTYKCASCAFTSAHASALGAHRRTQHTGACACARCGRAFVSQRGLQLHARTVHRGDAESEENTIFNCQECGLNFKSEGARRVHLLTSKQHKIKTSLCDTTLQDQSLKNTCSKCGIEFPTLKALVEHGRAEHRRTKKKTSWRLPGDSYPAKCDHCDTTVASRAEHWRHVRLSHPAQRSAYRPVITAVCETCGKGFQNSTKLALHRLRHGAPAVPCGRCARVFYDKYALARHAAAHAAARPHACARCHRTFKQRANRDRHERVHTGVTPYECTICGKKFKYSTSMNLHVRTVHYKLPHPPRKKKSDERNIQCEK